MPRNFLDDPDMPLARIFERCPEVVEVFLQRRMLCVGCPIAPFHRVVDACLEYGLDEDAFRAELHRTLRGRV